jgi:hypothetical protein
MSVPLVNRNGSWIFAWYKEVDIEIGAGAATASSDADTTLVWGLILWVYPVDWAADQVIELITLWSDGSITVDLADDSTAAVTYRVVIIKVTGEE